MTAIGIGDRVVVTGATGFVGQAVVERLAISGYEVVGVAERAGPPPEITQHLSDYHAADLTCEWPNVGSFDGLIHLAGLAAVGPSFDRPQSYINANSAMVTNIFEYVVQENWKGRALIVSSGAVYKLSAEHRPLTEDGAVEPTSPYVVSKLLVELQAEYYRRRGIDALIARPFNHIGPGQTGGFIVPDLVEKMRSHEPGSTLAAGNLDSERDYTDVRDIAAAYELILQIPHPEFSTYNICSGNSRTGWSVLEAICERLRAPLPQVEIANTRALDPSSVTGSSSRLTRETGWTPKIPFEKSIDDYVSSLTELPRKIPID
ncbi:hypothetical protein CYL16_12945 [Mycobacterium sp. EPG1]|nr:hypothetical protein CYL16_12945 [Mycobacterium sp. EPG1]